MRAKMNQRIQARRQKTQDNLKALRDDLVKHADMVTSRDCGRERETVGERDRDRERQREGERCGGEIWRRGLEKRREIKTDMS